MKKAAKGKAAKKAMKKPGRGGLRPGAGRKSLHEGGTKMVGGRVPVDVADWIAASGLSQTEAITQAVRTSPAYRIWREQNPAK